MKIAEARLVESRDTKTYIGGHGNPLFGKVINELVLGADSQLITEQRAGATQTPCGTGALRLAADFIAQCLPGKGVWLSNPTADPRNHFRRRQGQGQPLPVRRQ